MTDEPLGNIRHSQAENQELEDTDTVFKVVMLRSGDIEWDLGDIYCGWYDSKLRSEGREQIMAASELLKLDNYTFDLAYCSALSRCKDSLELILNALGIPDIEVIQSWELNERHCGSLTGLIKEKQPFLGPISLMSVKFYLLPQCLKIDSYRRDEISAKYGSDQALFWMTSYNHFPPPITKSHKYFEFVYNNELYPKGETLPVTESLEMIQKRLISFWNKSICPNILSGRKILIVTHNGCLQALVQYLDDIEYYDFSDTEIPRSIPFYYKFDETLQPILKDIPITNDLERRIADAFEVFDYSSTNEVEIREIGCIICALGCVPTEEDMEQILIDLESKENPGTVHLSVFLPYMANIFRTHKYEPATADTLLAIFHKLDPEGRGYVTRELLTKLLTEEGEMFTEDEIDEMMAIACDPQTQTIPYEYFINQLMFDPSEEDDNYVLADKIEAAKPKKEKKTVSQMMREAEQLASAEY